uniref:Uncharacterized protein n=1 Tax=Anguilla anguilla TaxID=7936 RepID=A0A0E9V1T9_ANGAN
MRRTEHSMAEVCSENNVDLNAELRGSIAGLCPKIGVTWKKY